MYMCITQYTACIIVRIFLGIAEFKLVRGM